MLKRLLTALCYIFIGIIVIIALYPILYIFFSSFKSAKEIMSGGINILPKSFTFENYVNAWKAGNFSNYTINSIIYSVFVTIGTVICTSLVAYCISRQEFKGKKFISACYYGAMFVAGAVTIYPVFMMLVKLKLNKTLLGLILSTIGMGQSFGVLMITSYFSGVPKELDESAVMDGCGPFRIYLNILLPVILPILGVVAMVTFQSTWNNYMLPLALTIATPKLRPLAVGVTALSHASDGKAAGQWDLLIAGSSMAMMPIILVYIFVNKLFVNEIMAGAVKG